MTDPAGERTPRRRGTGRPATEAGRARPGTTGRTERGGPGAGGSAGRAGNSAGEPPGRPPKSARPGSKAGSKAGTRVAEVDEPDSAGKAAGKAPRKSAARKPAAEADSAAKPGRDRPEPARGPGGRWPIAERSLLPSVLGVPPIAAVGLAAVLTAIGVFVDLTWVGNLSTVFTVCHIAGCVLAVAWVRRSGLFGPMVQPPLLVAAAVPVVVLLAGSPRPGQGVAEQLLVIGAPLVNAFPVMATTTGIVLALGLLRVGLQRS
jgi:hypothetical protein